MIFSFLMNGPAVLNTISRLPTLIPFWSMANFAWRQVLNGTLLVEEKVEDASKNPDGTKTQTQSLHGLWICVLIPPILLHILVFKDFLF